MGLSSFLTTLSGAYAMTTKRALPAYSFLETAEKEMLIGTDGSLGTMIRIDGTKKMMGREELTALISDANTRMSSYFARPGQAMQVWFCRDPDLSPTLVRNMMVAPRNVSRRLSLDLDDLFAERERVLPNYIVHECFYIVLWTRLSVLSKKDLEAVKESRKIPPLWPKALDSQNIFAAARQMTARHRAFVSSFCEDLRNFRIRNEVLDAHDALRVVKASIYPDMTDAPWKPYLPGDQGTDMKGRPNVPFPRRPEYMNDASHLLWPRISDQLFDREAEIVNGHVVRIGRHLFSSVDMTMGPQDILPFSDLINRMLQGEFPWRVSFLIEGDGIGQYSVRQLLASILGFTNSENKALVEAVKALAAYRKDGAVPRMRVSFATWGPEGKLDVIEERMNRLQRAVENWGYCHVSSNQGDPLAGVFSSACGLDVGSTAPSGLPPLEDALALLPWNRDASPFTSGSVLFRTADGRPWPFEPGSDQQDAHIDIIYAPPGRGKSVLLNTTNLAFCLSAKGTSGIGGAKLPLISIIDIGRSSSGLISLLKEALPAARRHEVVFERLRNTREYAINPFDLQLGCRKPLPHERSFLVNFVTLLATDSSETKAARGMSDLAAKAIDEVYESKSDLSKRGQPNRYSENVDYDVDNALRRYDIKLPTKPTWWNVVDALFEKNAIREASLAQRHAVPLMDELMQAVNSPQIMDIFGEAGVDMGRETLIKAFQRVISGCISEYKVLTAPTKFDLGEARVVSLDLDEVAPRGGGPADKQTAMFYMLGRYVLAKDYYLVEDNVSDMPQQYKAFHEQRIKRIRETPKKICFDEFHRTRTSPMVRDQVKIDMREGRKWGVQMVLLSQLLDDFDDDMVSLSSNFWILGAGQERDVNLAAEKFGLTKTATQAIQLNLNGPTPMGAPFLAVMQMKDGRHEHLLYNKIGPMEIWAFSTSPEDVGLRTRLYSMLGPSEARIRLAQAFPTGSARKEFERRIKEMSERGDATSSEAAESVIDKIAEEIMKRASAR